MVAATLEVFGRLDVLVNNGGAIRRGVLVHEMTTERWNEQLAVNLTGVFVVTRAALRAILERDGDRAIVNVASTLAVAAAPGVSPYTTAKGGVVALTRASALEYAEHGIRVNCISPWIVDTPLAAFDRPGWPQRKESFSADVPLGRLGGARGCRSRDRVPRVAPGRMGDGRPPPRGRRLHSEVTERVGSSIIDDPAHQVGTHRRERWMAAQAEETLGSFYGDDGFPIQWEEGEKELFWIYDDLHIPNPVSPMFFDIGGWWLTCDHMFRRFGTPFACDWIAKNVNGYVYTAAIPADPALHAEGTEYQARYVPRVPRDSGHAAQIGAYLGWALPHYAANFLDWWRERLRPEIERNFAYVDGMLARQDELDLLELAVLLEDAIDMHDRHWKIHWMLNFAQFSSTVGLNATIQEVKGEVDPSLMGRLQSSVEDRNWDSIEALWTLKGHVQGDDELREAFSGETAGEIIQALGRSERGRRFLSEELRPYQDEYGNRAIWSHEFAYKTWREDPAPIVEQIRGYLESDYDYPATIRGVKDDLDSALRELMDDVPAGAGRDRLQAALDMALNMNPLTPDHHFYVDQGTNARVRYVLVAIGRTLVERGDIDDPEDVMYLRYNDLRVLMADASAVDARSIVSGRRDEHEEAFRLRPREWIGTATQTALDFPYNGLWGFPEKFYREPSEKADELTGLAASPGVVEGPARVVLELEQFDQVKDGDVLVCRMTNPAWVVLFTKIVGLVTDAGGTVSHPAVVSREFGIPAVVGTSEATLRIKTGDRVRVNGAVGIVEILSSDGA